MPRKPKYTKAQILEAIKGCSTIVSTVAKRLGCDWNTAHIYINKWEETRTAYENERQTIGDFTEGKLIENVRKGDMGAIKYFLSKKYKDRGYGDELNATINAEGNQVFTFELVDSKDDADAES